LLLGGCSLFGSDEPKPTPFLPPAVAPVKALTESEGIVRVLARSGALSADDRWVQRFTQGTGCQVEVTEYVDAADFENRTQPPRDTETALEDGAADEGDAVRRVLDTDLAMVPAEFALDLVGAGTVAPVNLDLLPAAGGIVESLQTPRWSSWNDIDYGLAVGRGYYAVGGGASSLEEVFAPGANPDVPNSPTMLAAAALVLAQPASGGAADGADAERAPITDPFALDSDQLAAVQALATAAGPVPLPAAGGSSSGAKLAPAADLSNGEPPSDAVLGWSDSWMVPTDPAHPTCAYRLLDAVLAPAVNLDMAKALGAAPAIADACPDDASGFCVDSRAGDEEFWSGVEFVISPLQQCLDGREEVRCSDSADFAAAWTAALTGQGDGPAGT
jgi:putative spermidine/putrescine transport system substrate-binding protein